MTSAETVLITGSRGFTGSYLRQALLKDGWYVHGVVRDRAEDEEESACDLTDLEAVRELVHRVKPDRVVHLAALSFVGESDAEAFYRVNLFATLNLLQALAAMDTPVHKIVLASSANVYGRPSVERIDESLCPAPVNHYGCSKLSMEHMAATWFDKLPIIITRPFNYTGPGQEEHFLVPKIASHFARRDSVIELGNLDVSREFNDVRDVAEAYRRLLTCEAHSLRVNICSGQARSLRSILEICERLTGHWPEIRVNPDLVRSSEIPVLVGDPSRLENIVGKMERIPFERTLQDMTT